MKAEPVQLDRPNGIVIPPVVPEAESTLSDKHRQVLLDRAINDDVAKERGYRTYSGPTLLLAKEGRLSKSQRSPKLYPVLVYPTFACGAAKPVAYVLRPDNPRKKVSSGGRERILKYEYPRGAPQVLDVLPSRAKLLGDPTVDLWIPEGILKADALTSAGAPVAAAINGVYGWRGSNDQGGKLILPDFEQVALNGRRVVLAFDSDMVRNAQIMQAARRVGAWMSTKGAQVMVLMLPQDGDAKVGVDDFLALQSPEQRTIVSLQPYLVPLEEGTRTFTDRFGVTADGLELLNPPGYQNRRGPLTYTHPQTGVTKTVYQGYLAVTARGHDRATGEATLTVAWRDGEERDGVPVVSVTAPQAELATARGVIKTLSSKGATVHDKNAKDVSEFLLEFARLNARALPTKVTTDHYGYNGDGIVGPGWSVGKAVSYNGGLTLKTKTSGADAYIQAVREACGWGAMPLMLALGLSAVSPHLERLGTVRNPVMWLSGESNYGKTTLGEFAVGLYADPRGLSIQTGRSTWAGFTQRLAYLRGLPALFDESQTADSARLQNVIYQHANGQTYAKGGADGQPLGNNALHGAVIVLGETAPQLTFKGARNRVLDLRAEKHLPLGVGPHGQTLDNAPSGSQRSAILRDAVSRGAGSLGERLTQAIWDDWEAFEERVGRHQAEITSGEAAEWARPLAAAAAGLDYLLEVCGIPLIERPLGLTTWAHNVLCTSRIENDVALEAFEALRALVLNASIDQYKSNVRSIRGEKVAYETQAEFYVLPSSDAVKRTLEPYGGLQGLGTQWVRREWIEADSGGKSTPGRRIEGSLQRVLVVPHDIMVGKDEDD